MSFERRCYQTDPYCCFKKSPRIHRIYRNIQFIKLESEHGQGEALRNVLNTHPY